MYQIVSVLQLSLLTIAMKMKLTTPSITNAWKDLLSRWPDEERVVWQVIFTIIIYSSLSLRQKFHLIHFY